MGMTTERQLELRGKLYSMLGDRGQAAAASSSSSSRAKEHSKSLKSKEHSTKSKECSLMTGFEHSLTSIMISSSDNWTFPAESSAGSGLNRSEDLRVSVALSGEGGDAIAMGGERVQSPIGIQYGMSFSGDGYNDDNSDRNINSNNNNNIDDNKNKDNNNNHDNINNHDSNYINKNDDNNSINNLNMISSSNINDTRGSDKNVDVDDRWACSACTLLNEINCRRCATCDMMRDRSSQTGSAH